MRDTERNEVAFEILTELNYIDSARWQMLRARKFFRKNDLPKLQSKAWKLLIDILFTELSILPSENASAWAITETGTKIGRIFYQRIVTSEDSLQVRLRNEFYERIGTGLIDKKHNS